MHKCRVCENSQNNKIHLFQERYLGLGYLFEYIECGECQSLSIVDVPKDMGRYYPDNYYSYAGKPYNRLLGFVKGHRDRYCLGRSDVIGQLVSFFNGAPVYIEWLLNLGLSPGATVLDVGCGAGTLVVNLKDAGFNPVGIDPYISKSINYANGVKILKQQLEETEGSYDCIMLHHCLEHMASPRDLFAQINRLLKPSGRLLIRIPLTNTHAWKTYGEYWFQLDAPRHFVLFTEQALCSLAKEYGFRVERIVYDSTASQFWGSEQYVRGIAHTGRNSYAYAPSNSCFSPREIQRFDDLADELNRRNDGDQAAFYFTRVTKDE